MLSNLTFLFRMLWLGKVQAEVLVLALHLLLHQEQRHHPVILIQTRRKRR